MTIDELKAMPDRITKAMETKDEKAGFRLLASLVIELAIDVKRIANAAEAKNSN